MPDQLLPIRNIQFTRAPQELRATGLLGFISLLYGEMLLDGLTVRRTRDRRLVLVFPERRTEYGAFPYSRPARLDVHAEIEAVVIAELRRRGVLP